MLTALTDLRGKGRWLLADYAREADLYVVGSYWQEKPIAGKRTFAQVSATYLTLDGNVSGEPGSLNKAIGTTLPALENVPPLWVSDDGRQTQIPLDLTQRHVASELADLMVSHLSWPDGLNIDWYGFGWAYPPEKYPQYDADFWKKFDDQLQSWVEQMRSRKPAWVFTGQHHQITPPCGALNGLYLEQSLTSFGETLNSHTGQVKTFQSLAKLSGREVVFIAELREPGKFPDWYQAAFKAWCETNGAYASVGRDQFAGQPL